MKIRSITQYFTGGFLLANKNIELFLLSGLLIAPSFIRGSLFFSILSLVCGLLNSGFVLSFPLFLSRKQKGDSLDLRHLWRDTFKNTKRILLPILIVFILGLALIFLSLMLALVFNVKENQIISFFQGSTVGWSLTLVVLSVLASSLMYTSIFFSLENKGLWTSAKKSIVFSFKHLQFTGLLAFVSVVFYFLISVIPSYAPWGYIIQRLLGGYVGIVITASVLLYYQRVSQTDSSPQ